MDKNAKRVERRRSSSESHWDHLSSTVNPVNPDIPDNLITPNIDRCVSQPNVSGFIDETYCGNAGTRLQTRCAVGGSNIENEIRTKRDFEDIESRIDLDLSIIYSPSIPNNVEPIMTSNQDFRINTDLVRSNNLTISVV